MNDQHGRHHQHHQHHQQHQQHDRPARRAAITGIGLVTPIGNNAVSTWSALLEGQSGIAPIRHFDASGFPTHIGAEVKGFDPGVEGIDRKLLARANRYARFALAAASEALRDAGVRPAPSDADRWGCVTGSGMMSVSFEELTRFQRAFAPDGVLRTEAMMGRDAPPVDQMELMRSQPNLTLGALIESFGIRGPSSVVHTACASGGQALGTALRYIRRGDADRVLAGGCDSMLNPIGLSAFSLLGALSTDNHDPPRASRPFDRTRSGFVLGEGAGFLVLEEGSAARRRGARIYAELAGNGDSLSGYRITDTHPSGDGPIQAMRAALADAGALPGEVDYINAHGTSTVMNDQSECAAVRAVLGAEADRVPVSSTKSIIGHLIAAAGAVEAAFCALAIHHGIAPINANLREEDPACNLCFIRGEPLRGRIRVALSNSFGFGGSNSCLVLREAGQE